MTCKPATVWALQWNSKNCRPHLLHSEALPCLFRTRDEARKYANERLGYIKRRPDLREDPHGWRMPTPIRVVITKV